MTCGAARHAGGHLLAAALALGCGDGTGAVPPGPESPSAGIGGRSSAGGTSGTPGAAGKAQGGGGVAALGGAGNGGSLGGGAGTVSSGRGGSGGAPVGGAGTSGGASGSGAGTQGGAGATGAGGAGAGGAPGTGGTAGAGGAPNAGGGGRGGAAGAAGSSGSAGATAGSGGSIDIKNVTASCPGAVPGGVTATWCSCEQWGEKTVGLYTYYNDIWGSGPGPQCIWLADSGAWGVASSHPSGGGIKAYPNVSVSPKQVISNINGYSTTFDMIVPSGGAYDSAYDLWVKGTTAARIEIMLWMSYRGGAQPIAKSYDASGAAVADEKNVTVGGHTWNVYYGSNGSNDVASFVRTSNTTSGTIDIKAILSWLIANNHSSYGVFTASYTLDQVQFGHEITTDTGTQAYVLRSFSVASN